MTDEELLAELNENFRRCMESRKDLQWQLAEAQQEIERLTAEIKITWTFRVNEQKALFENEKLLHEKTKQKICMSLLCGFPVEETMMDTDWTKGKPQIATEEQCQSYWGGGFWCYICGTEFKVGDYWRFVWGQNQLCNFKVCKLCDKPNEELISEVLQVRRKYAHMFIENDKRERDRVKRWRKR